MSPSYENSRRVLGGAGGCFLLIADNNGAAYVRPFPFFGNDHRLGDDDAAIVRPLYR